MEKNEYLTQTIASNLVYYRKLMNLTQSQLADKISYSDKAVSKWERGEGVPDIFVLKELASIYHVTVNDLISDEKRRTKPNYRRNKILITLLSVTIPWMVSVLLYVVISFTPLASQFKTWLIYIYAIPVTFIITLVFSCLWFKKIWVLVSESGIIWSVCLSLFLSFTLSGLVDKYEYLFFILGVPVQIGFIFWFFLKRKSSLAYLDETPNKK